MISLVQKAISSAAITADKAIVQPRDVAGTPQLMLVGYVPWDTKEAFQNYQGELVRRLLADVGVSVDRVWLTYLVKYDVGDAVPPPAEMAQWSDLLLSEIKIVSPRLVMLMGRHVCAEILGIKAITDRAIAEYHTLKATGPSIFYFPTYSPEELSSDEPGSSQHRADFKSRVGMILRGEIQHFYPGGSHASRG